MDDTLIKNLLKIILKYDLTKFKAGLVANINDDIILKEKFRYTEDELVETINSIINDARNEHLFDNSNQLQCTHVELCSNNISIAFNLNRKRFLVPIIKDNYITNKYNPTDGILSITSGQLVSFVPEEQKITNKELLRKALDTYSTSNKSILNKETEYSLSPCRDVLLGINNNIIFAINIAKILHDAINRAYDVSTYIDRINNDVSHGVSFKRIVSMTPELRDSIAREIKELGVTVTKKDYGLIRDIAENVYNDNALKKRLRIKIAKEYVKHKTSNKSRAPLQARRFPWSSGTLSAVLQDIPDGQVRQYIDNLVSSSDDQPQF